MAAAMPQTPTPTPEEIASLPPPAPKELICPITQELMVDPVFAEDGFSYERIAMERWFSTGKRRSPVTNEILTDRSTQLTPNKVIKTMIQNYRREVGAKLIIACKLLNDNSSSVAEEGMANLSNIRPITSLALAAYIDAGADVNIRDEDGNSPLMLLLQNGKVQLAREILEYGAKASQRNDLGTSALNLCEKLRDSGHGMDDIPGPMTSAWNDLIAQLEEMSAKEVIEDEAKEKAREISSAAARQRASDLEREESRAPAATQAMSVGEALQRAHIGPGLGFFPSLFALQFQGGMPHPLTRPDMENAGPGEIEKIKLFDRILKGGAILLTVYILFII